MAGLPAINHVALTVSDLERSKAWYTRLLEADPVMSGEEDSFRYVVWLQPLLSLHQHVAPETGAPFSELRPGLDHVAFGCNSRAELESWMGRLGELGIDHGEIVDAPYGSALAFRDPDNIALELFALAG